jgi:hypothetical protein
MSLFRWNDLWHAKTKMMKSKEIIGILPTEGLVSISNVMP